MRSADLLLQAGGFGMVAVDLGSADARATRRIPLTWWYRFRRAVEQTRTALVIVSGDRNARQCATLSVESRRMGVKWTRVLASVEWQYQVWKPVGTPPARLMAPVAGLKSRAG